MLQRKEELFYEDFVPNMAFEFGHYSMTKDRMVAFGREFDPQPFHIGNLAPGEFGSNVIASGWHTGAATMRMLVDHLFAKASTLPSPGVEQMRFIKPVFPGDHLRIRVLILETRITTKQDRGLVRYKVETINNRDEIVMMMTALGLFRRRTP